MRRFLLSASALVLVLLLAACGNKGPLVRASTDQATASPTPAATVPAAAVTAPAPAASTALNGQP